MLRVSPHFCGGTRYRILGKPIHFRRVVEFDQRRADEAIARTAIEQLRADADKGHILMARTENVERAKHIFKIYEQYPEFNPVQLHTGIKSSRIWAVVCVAKM